MHTHGFVQPSVLASFLRLLLGMHGWAADDPVSNPEEAIMNAMQPPRVPVPALDPTPCLLEVETVLDRSAMTGLSRGQDDRTEPRAPGIPVLFAPDGRSAWITLSRPGEQDATVSAALSRKAQWVRTFSVSCPMGGMLVLTATAQGTLAELSFFGSGVPIISSVRGRLVPSPPHHG
jgi:hypothetical protein